MHRVFATAKFNPDVGGDIGAQRHVVGVAASADARFAARYRAHSVDLSPRHNRK